jgi:hypothetical protein
VENQKVVIRFDEVCLRDKYGLRRIEGTATIDSMIRLIDIADLKANPREAKVGEVTEDIQDSLKTTPQWFHFKSKGILLAVANCLPRERSRFELTFEDGDIEGILDGGHNLLAIALFILNEALGDEASKILRTVKRWEQVPSVWKGNRDKIEEVKNSLSFLTPIEIIYPQEGAQGRDEFQDAVLDVARARNNNAQLTEETKAHKAGFYEAIKQALDPALVSEVEWKTNDGGRIKVRDLVALSWIPLSKLADELPANVSPDAIYRSKGACVAAFNKLLESDDISHKAKGEIRELHHHGVKSAIDLLRDIPRLFDYIYAKFPDAYNNASPGFGRINSVRVWDPTKSKSRDPKYLKHPPLTKFYRDECKYDFPDGFVMPLMWALGELMEYRDGKVGWKSGIDPFRFIDRNLDKTMAVYYGIIQMANYDPQKVGKIVASYHLVANDFKSRLPRGD